MERFAGVFGGPKKPEARSSSDDSKAEADESGASESLAVQTATQQTASPTVGPEEEGASASEKAQTVHAEVMTEEEEQEANFSLADSLSPKALKAGADRRLVGRWHGYRGMHAAKAQTLQRRALGIRQVTKATVFLVHKAGQWLGETRSELINEHGPRLGGRLFLEWAIEETGLTKSSVHNYLAVSQAINNPNQVRHLSLKTIYKASQKNVDEETREAVFHAKSDDEALELLRERRTASSWEGGSDQDSPDAQAAATSTVSQEIQALKRLIQDLQAMRQHAASLPEAAWDGLEELMANMEQQIHAELERLGIDRDQQ